MPGEQVLVQTPVYNCFFSCIKNSGCEVVENELRRVGNCTYEIDFEDFERKCADEKTTVFILCNPHNPAGRVWKKEELERMNDICLKHNVKIVADEIHCELVMPGYQYIPFASISEACRDNCVVLNSPSKSFNIAGGYDKKIPYDEMGEVVPKTVKLLILMGATADKIEEATRKASTYSEGNPEIIRVNSMEEAVKIARERAESGDIVSMSPASASFDMYKNFAEKGLHYKRLVMEL